MSEGDGGRRTPVAASRLVHQSHLLTHQCKLVRYPGHFLRGCRLKVR
jgi:hypothetical protein